MMNLIISYTNMNTIDLHHAGSFYQPGNLKFTLFYQLVTCYQLVTRQKLVTSLVTKLVVLRCKNVPLRYTRTQHVLCTFGT